MAKITYTDKETLNEIPSIPAKNKVQAADMNEIKNVVNQNELKILLIADSSAPAECSTGDMYYNTTTKKIYTATGTNTWGSTGVNPTQNTLYIDYTNKSTYFYNGSDLISVGGGAGGESLKIGTIVPFAGSTIPDGYLTCDGTAVSRTTYSDLFAVIGTTYGAGDGSTTFNLPNLKGRVPVGLDGTDTDFDTIGETGGSKFLQEHTHTYEIRNCTQLKGAVGIDAPYYPTGSGWSDTNNWTTSTAGTGNSGNLQPYQVVNYIIKVAQTTPVQAEIVNSYSTSTTDGYSANYVNNAIETAVQDVYSTDEVKTNKVWIDNKPIYRKVITATTNQVDLSSLNYDFITSVHTILIVSNYIRTPYYKNSGDYFRILIDPSKVMDLETSVTTYTWVTTLEYTKTTD